MDDYCSIFEAGFDDYSVPVFKWESTEITLKFAEDLGWTTPEYLLEDDILGPHEYIEEVEDSALMHIEGMGYTIEI